MSGQQERIPTGEWRKVYSIYHARIKARPTQLNITLLPHTLDCDGEINKDTPDKTVLHSYNNDTVLNKETCTTSSSMILVSSMDTEPSAT